MRNKAPLYPHINPFLIFLGMSINQFSRLFIVTIVLTVTGVSVIPTAIAQNKKGGNMTGQYTGPDFEPTFTREGEIPLWNPNPRESPCNPEHPDCFP